MTGKSVVIAGASGFIGSHFKRRFEAEGWAVRTIGRATGHDARWDDDGGIAKAHNGAELLVNLAGRSVNCRYTSRNRAEILKSRTDTTAVLGQAVGLCAHSMRKQLVYGAAAAVIAVSARQIHVDQ